MAQAKSYVGNKNYSDAIISLSNAFTELGKVESLSGEIKPSSALPSFEAIFIGHRLRNSTQRSSS